MLEGLGITDVRLSVASANKDFRIDGDFWVKEPKPNPNLKYDKIGNCLVNAQYGVSIEMNEDGNGLPIYRMNEIHDMLCDFMVSKSAELSKDELDIFKLNDGDVLFNRTNSFEWVGRTGLYKKIGEREFVFASYLVRFVPNKKIILPEYLTAFLNSKQGVWDIKRRARQSINQTNVNPEEVKQIDIPMLDMKIQALIKECFDKAVSKKQASGSLYSEAENLLLQELGLANWQPSIKNNNTKTLKESFIESGRFDAEYYQPKYDELEDAIKKLNYKLIKEIRTVNYRGLQPEYVEEGTLDIINSKHILDTSLDYENFEKTSLDFWDLQERARVFLYDILTYTTGANIGRTQTYLINKPALASNHVNIIRLAKQNPVYVGFVLNSIVGRLQTEKRSAGSAQLELYPKDLDEFLIPILSDAIQRQIAEKVQESFRLQKQSKALLEAAKTAVEIAIEQDEQTALKYLQNFNDA